MKTKKFATLSTLAGGVLLILALFRGRVSQLLLIAYLCLWTIVWVIGWVRDADNLDHKEEREPSRCKRRLVLSNTMLSYMSNFIHTGNPNGSGLPHWSHLRSRHSFMVFGDSAPCMGTVELGRLLKNTVHSNGIGM